MPILEIPPPAQINIHEFRDKVLGCWQGKNIGGTLGAPMEGTRQLGDISFYTQETAGRPAPNDDLDLQLVWLLAVEQNGAYRLNERILGEYWMRYITGPWNEYGTAKGNIAAGLYPPLSGFCNNAEWQNSNGAWIRSEIWACLFPGAPDEAARFAWMDACVDHCGDGIYAEIFTAALESAAFVEQDLLRLIDIALARIPDDCRIARSVKLARSCHQEGIDWRPARNRLVEESADLGWFQAPANVGFVVLGLLYGQGDFGKSLCIAVNCGDDTDCTGTTVGAVLGILKGRSGLPQRWIEPIGNEIKTAAVSTLWLFAPATVEELSERIIRDKQYAEKENPLLPRLIDGPTCCAGLTERLTDGSIVRERILTRSSRRLAFSLPWGELAIEYGQNPMTSPGERQKLRISVTECPHNNRLVRLDWKLPEGWELHPGPGQLLQVKQRMEAAITVELVPGEFPAPMVYLQLELHLSDRLAPCWIAVPFGLRGAVGQEHQVYCKEYKDTEYRRTARFNGINYPQI